MTLSRFDLGSTPVQPQKPLTSSFYSTLNGLDFKTMLLNTLTLNLERV